jgi:hypothetical protein
MKAQIIYLCSAFLLLTASLSAQKKKVPVDVKIEAVYAYGYAPINVLLRYAEHRIKITVEGYPDAGVVFTNALAKKYAGNDQHFKDIYFVSPKEEGKLTISVYKNKKCKKSQLLSAQEFNVIKFPEFIITYAGKQSGEVSRENLLADSMLHLNYDTLPVGIIITNFEIKVIVKGKEEDPIYISVNERNIPVKLKKIIKAAPLGTQLIFDSIRLRSVYGEDSSIKRLGPFVFIIVDD